MVYTGDTMSDTAHNETLKQLLEQSGLAEKAESVGPAMYRLRWGSANVITGIAGGAIVVIAPMFEKLPETNQDAFCRRLLELNNKMGGTASFGITAESSVVLQVGRGLDGLDGQEFKLMLGMVGKFADEFDNQLHDEFYK